MRPAARSASPELLVEHGAAWCQKYVKKRAADPAYRFRWKQYQRQRVNVLLREPLSTMTQEHCAYCDGFPLDATSYETIDHFLPKAHYPELVYAWDNLYLACVKCQQEKESNFDTRVDRATYQDELLRPDEPGYRFERYFLFNYQSGDIEPNPGASALDQARGIHDPQPGPERGRSVAFAQAVRRLVRRTAGRGSKSRRLAIPVSA